MQKFIYPRHGAKQRPDHLKTKDRVSGAALPFDWSKVTEDTVGNVANLFGIADKDQGGSLSCTCQTTGYGFAYSKGIEISREDMYSHVVLPGGGAYLNAPLDWLRKNGYLVHPDPSPETEANMAQIIQVQVGDRIRTFLLTYTFYGATIDGAAFAITNHRYIHLGVKGSWTSGWDPSWVDPSYKGVEDWDHAVFAGKESIVLRHGVPAIKAKSSWCQHIDPAGNPVYCHYLTKPYFDSNGVFEVIGVDIGEINNMIPTDQELGQLWQAAFGRSIDPAGLAFNHGKTLDVVLNNILSSKEHLEYTRIAQAVKLMENDIRGGQF